MINRKVTWTKSATNQFEKIIDYIRQDSEQNADKVKEKILKKINQLSDDGVMRRKDPYKKKNDGKYLFFEVLKYRIVYYGQKRFLYFVSGILAWNRNNIKRLLLTGITSNFL